MLLRSFTWQGRALGPALPGRPQRLSLCCATRTHTSTTPLKPQTGFPVPGVRAPPLPSQPDTPPQPDTPAPPGYIYNTAQAPSSSPDAVPSEGEEGEELHVCVGRLVVGSYAELPKLNASFTHVLHVGPGDRQSGQGAGAKARAGIPSHVQYRALPLNPTQNKKMVYQQLDHCIAHLRHARSAHWAPHGHDESIFVCCVQGGSYSAVVALAHLMDLTDSPLEDLLPRPESQKLMAAATDGLFQSVWVDLLSGWDRWRRQTNLLQETLQAMAEHGKVAADVQYVILDPVEPGVPGSASGVEHAAAPGAAPSGSCCNFASFAALAGQLRYAKYDLNKISAKLQICGKDWWMTRGDYGGFEEWWEFHTRPARPPELRECAMADILGADWTPETAAEPELRWKAWVNEGHAAPREGGVQGAAASPEGPKGHVHTRFSLVSFDSNSGDGRHSSDSSGMWDEMCDHMDGQD